MEENWSDVTLECNGEWLVSPRFSLPRAKPKNSTCDSQRYIAAKKCLLFYGPPETGKTHTIHFLATKLPGHTTLIVTAELVALLSYYFQLARFLQPSMLVIEDVDLIAWAREQMRGGCEESLLNKLLNEMDGLRADTSALFVLATNRPEQLEAALASLPGRIEQATEFPLPDKEGRLHQRADAPFHAVSASVRRVNQTLPERCRSCHGRNALPGSLNPKLLGVGTEEE